jgi:hypothetical protein
LVKYNGLWYIQIIKTIHCKKVDGFCFVNFMFNNER